MMRETALAETLVNEERVSVNRFTFAPGAETGFHVHEFDYVITAITDCSMMIEEEGSTREVFVKAGEAYSRKAGVAHNVINDSAAEMVFVEVELKP